MPPRSHTNPLFFKYKILKIQDLYTFQLGQFMYNYNNNSLPCIFHSMFPKNQSFHNYPTRRSNEFHLPLLRTLLAQKTFIYTGPRVWNSFDKDIKVAKSLYSFKKKLKSSLLISYCRTDLSWVNKIYFKSHHHHPYLFCSFETNRKTAIREAHGKLFLIFQFFFFSVICW